MIVVNKAERAAVLRASYSEIVATEEFESQRRRFYVVDIAKKKLRNAGKKLQGT